MYIMPYTSPRAQQMISVRKRKHHEYDAVSRHQIYHTYQQTCRCWARGLAPYYTISRLTIQCHITSPRRHYVISTVRRDIYDTIWNIRHDMISLIRYDIYETILYLRYDKISHHIMTVRAVEHKVGSSAIPYHSTPPTRYDMTSMIQYDMISTIQYDIIWHTWYNTIWYIHDQIRYDICRSNTIW